MYALLGISIVLAALLTINALSTLLAAVIWRAFSGSAQNWTAEMRARVIFALRLFPMIGAIACALIILIPSYLTHEPTDTNEVVSRKLAALAFVSAIGIALALWRGVASWRATRHLNADWLRHATPLKLDGISIPTYLISHPFPVVAITGALKPRLFIATQVLEALNETELAAAMAHERGHLAMYDNLKRTSLRACRAVLTAGARSTARGPKAPRRRLMNTLRAEASTWRSIWRRRWSRSRGSCPRTRRRRCPRFPISSATISTASPGASAA
jgi:Zn-dependent protease with chaperone function